MQVLFGDGAAGSGLAPEGIPVEVAPDGSSIPNNEQVCRAPGEVTGWRLVCDCGTGAQGWVSPNTWTRVPSTALEDLDARKVHCDDDDTWIDDRPGVQRLAVAEWEQDHLAPTTAVDEIRHAREESQRAAGRLDDAVQAARANGVAWSSIGSAAGMSRQSAHERWAR